MELFQDCENVRKIPNKPYAFVEFSSQSAAITAIKRTTENPYVLDGKTLTVRWGKNLDEVETGECRTVCYSLFLKY